MKPGFNSSVINVENNVIDLTEPLKRSTSETERVLVYVKLIEAMQSIVEQPDEFLVTVAKA